MEERDGSSCRGVCKGVQIPTDEELTALDAMRTIRREATILKKRVQRLVTSNDEASVAEGVQLEGELQRFKEEWRRWDEKRREAARRRMVLLGHEEA